MRKQKVLFLCTQNSARSQMAEGFLRHLAGDRFEVYSAGIDPTGEIHPCAVEAMWEVGIDISDQYPKGLREYMGKQTFNYLIIVCARAEERCPKTFPGVGTTFSWVFEDPRRDEDLPYDSILERFRAVRDQIEVRMREWLEHPEEELRKLREARERERRERLEEVLEAKLEDTERKMAELAAFRQNLLYYRERAEDLKDRVPTERYCADVSFCGCLEAVTEPEGGEHEDQR
jgi:arsenate reductase (thioredoxin)